MLFLASLLLLGTFLYIFGGLPDVLALGGPVLLHLVHLLLVIPPRCQCKTLCSSDNWTQPRGGVLYISCMDYATEICAGCLPETTYSYAASDM